MPAMRLSKVMLSERRIVGVRKLSLFCPSSPKRHPLHRSHAQALAECGWSHLDFARPNSAQVIVSNGGGWKFASAAARDQTKDWLCFSEETSRGPI